MIQLQRIRNDRARARCSVNMLPNHGLQPTAARGIVRPPRLKPGR